MKHLRLTLPDKLLEELHLAAADTGELDEPEVCSIEDFARECIEVVIADRRARRFASN
jgi:hypothetical protein